MYTCVCNPLINKFCNTDLSCFHVHAYDTDAAGPESTTIPIEITFTQKLQALEVNASTTDTIWKLKLEISKQRKVLKGCNFFTTFRTYWRLF